MLAPILAAICGLTSPTLAQAKPVKPVLPRAIATAFHQTYPKATILAFSRETENGRTIYEVESRDGTTRRDLLYTPTGTTLEIEETLPAAELPAPVRNAVETAAPGAKVTRAERVTRDTVVTYEIAVRVGGKARSLVIDPGGKPVRP